MWGAALIGLLPMLLLGFSVLRSDSERILGMSSLWFGILLIADGFLAYGLDIILRPARAVPPTNGGLD